MDANQARRRTEVDLASTYDREMIIHSPKAFIYKPLDPDQDTDSIRLVSIEQSTNKDDPISCIAEHVKFADKPKYRALSYMWGDQAVKAKILLNDAPFQVGQNLWDALHYLRQRNDPNRMPLWIDAICINQEDGQERNRQLAMMKWIYFRANTVVVWLGKKYSKYQLSDQLSSNKEPAFQIPNGLATTSITTPASSEPSEDETTKGSVEQRAMVMELCSDGYWDRLWIIQEIGRARQKEVCFGTISREWTGFIEMVTLHNSGSDGPLRLNRLLQEKYTGSHTLRKLLQDHRGALCKEPRDKIYGLVGLAADANGFPHMDYNKPLIEIWKDTMIFMNAQGLLPEHDIIPFGRLVKSLLIRDGIGPLEQTLRPYESHANSALTMEASNSSRIFTLRGYVVGYIVAVGPSTDQIISSSSSADKWASKVQQHFKEELGQAHRENDKLMHSILDFSEPQLASMCFDHVSNVRWSKQMFHRTPDVLYYYKDDIKQAKSQDDTSTETQASATSNDVRVSSISVSHLFLVENSYRRQTPWKMGIASSLAKPRDLVCWINGVTRALVLRVSTPDEYKATLQIFGTAQFTDDFIPDSGSTHSSRLSWFREVESLFIQMDAATI